jgi:hypothetical protein
MALDEKRTRGSRPLPVLLRIPWFPAESPPATVSAEVVAVEEAEPRSFPLVIQHTIRRPGPSHSQRPRSLLLVLALLGAFVGAMAAWYIGPLENGDGSAPEAVSDVPDWQDPTPAEPSSRPHPAASLAPEIIPIDSGDVP